VEEFDPQPHLVGRLVELRPLRAEDYDALYAAASDPLIWELHPDERWREDVFRDFFAQHLASGGALLILDPATGEVIGTSRYHGYDAERSEVEIGWTFLVRSRWGGAANGELKQLMLDHAFRSVDRVIFLAAVGNLRSRRAIEKLGATFVETRWQEHLDRESAVYELRRTAG
jgi:RimJ/RimL family protein N-acetyltransferase